MSTSRDFFFNSSMRPSCYYTICLVQRPGLAIAISERDLPFHESQTFSVQYFFTWLPWRLCGKESPCQCRRLGFNSWVEKIPWRRKWQPIPIFLLGTPMDRGAWWATVHGVAKESDTTQQLNNDDNREGRTTDSRMLGNSLLLANTLIIGAILVMITIKQLSLSPLPTTNYISNISLFFKLPLFNVNKIFGSYVYHENALGHKS